MRLASASQRRLTLLQQVGLNPEVWPTHVDETLWPGENAHHYVERMAKTKALAGLAPEVDLVLGADTAVVLGGTHQPDGSYLGEEIMGKPTDANEAVAMLTRLSGKVHRVLTGVAVFADHEHSGISVVVETKVRFKILTIHEINAYVATQEPLDKAGAYAIQGIGAFLVAHVDGSYSGVVGLPLFETLEILQSFGLTFCSTR
ncbi:MAG: septum formation inhibitor Maf [Magnetococcales bacterium]|nr:septum formation inhibitor Maf [Magnetococcales bacterium]